MNRRLMNLPLLLLLLLFTAGAAGRPPDPPAHFARLMVQLVGFSPGTSFVVTADASYKLVDPTAPFAGKPPRGVHIPLSDAMVKRLVRAKRPYTWQGTVLTSDPVEKVLEFQFTQPLNTASPGMHAFVSVPVVFSYFDPATGEKREAEQLGSVLNVGEDGVDARCFRIQRMPRGLKFRVLKDCSDQ